MGSDIPVEKIKGSIGTLLISMYVFFSLDVFFFLTKELAARVSFQHGSLTNRARLGLQDMHLWLKKKLRHASMRL